MKNISYLLLILLLVTLKGNSQPFSKEIEYQLMKEADPNFKIERKKWMEDMHRTAPGTDYKIINASIREQKHKIMQQKIESMLFTDFKKAKFLSDTIADGKLVGKWIERGSNNLAGRTMTCDIDWKNNLIYNASHGGNIWRGTLNGENWTCLNEWLQMQNIILLRVIEHNNSKRIIAVNGSYLYYSDNEGLTWIPSFATGGMSDAVMTGDDSHYIYITKYINDSELNKMVTRIYRSTDKGETFEKIHQLAITPERCDLWTPRYYSSDVYFMHLDTLSKINKDGTVTKLSNINIENFNNYKTGRLSGTANESGNTIYLWLQNKTTNHSHFFSSSDSGNTWVTLATLDYGPFMANSFEASCIHPEALYFGGVNCSRSHDNGKTWELVNDWPDYYRNIETKLHADLPAITSFMNPNGEELVIISTDGGTFVSYDNLLTVQNISLHGLNVSQYYSTYSFKDDPDIIFVGSQDQGFQRTTAVDEDGTHSFQQTISGDYAHLTSSDGGNTLWHVYPGFTMVYRLLAQPSMTSSATLDFKETGSGGLWMRPIIADPKDPNVAYLAGGGTDGYHHIWKMTYANRSITGTQMPFQFSNKDAISALGISNVNKDMFYALTNNGDFFFSSNRGQNWSKSEGFAKLGGHYFYGASIAPSNIDANTVYIAGSGYSNPGAYVSYDGGESFSPMNDGLPKTLVYRIAVSDNDEYIFAATAVGPYIYIKANEKWYDLSGFNTPDQIFWSVEYIPSIRTARFATYGRGIWDFKIEDEKRIAEVTLSEPMNREENVELNVNLKWSVSPNAEYYHLQIANDAGFQQIIFENDGLSTNMSSSSELKPNGTYYWRVKAKKGLLSSTWSTVFSFKTITVQPQIPAMIYPKPDAKQVALMPTFQWESVPYATSYHIQVSQYEDFSILDIDNDKITENSFTDEYYFMYGTNYFWRIKAKINDMESSFSEPSKFTTVAPKPEAPSLVYPTFGQNNLPLNLEIIWTEVENADYYTLNMASDNQFKNMLFEKDSIFWYSYKFSDELKSNKIYMWRVRANNLSGGSPWSETRMFVTGSHVDVKEIFDNDNIKIFQDNEKLFVKFEDGLSRKYLFQISDILGNTVKEFEIHSGLENSNFVFDISNLNIGAYLYLISVDGVIIKSGKIICY